MEITDVETRLVGTDTGSRTGGGHAVDRWLFVQVHTDAGITGLGEAGAWGYLEPTASAVETFADYLIGRDPLRREHHWQYCYRNSHFRGATLSAAISAIDVALWDVAGKYFDAPVYELLGGKCREEARAYVHAFGETTDDLVAACEAAKDEGFTAVGHLSPLLDQPRGERYAETHAELVAGVRERVRRYREAVGEDVDLCVEMHRRLDPEQAVVAAAAIEQFDPMFYEDPVRPDNFDAMAEVAAKTAIPIATGERIHTPHEFEMLLERDALGYARPNVGLAGGLTGAKKIAGLCESQYVDVVPHNPLSPVTTAASLQLDAAIPNFGIQEFPFRPDMGEAPGEALIQESIEWKDGYLEIPDRPGIGVTLDEEVVSELEAAYVPREFETRLHRDGSVVDQ